MADYLYYVISDDPTKKFGINIKGFTRNNRAEIFAKTATNPTIIRYSKLALSNLKMAFLMNIVRAGTDGNPGAPKVTQLKRDDLVDAAFSCLWAACQRTGSLQEHDPSDTNLNEENGQMAKKNTGGDTATAEAPTNVREMRKSAKKATGDAPAAAAKPKREPKPDEYAGKRISLVGKDNPRREGTHGHRSMEVVRNKPGITYEDYIAGGGRRVDLKGSIELKQVELK